MGRKLFPCQLQIPDRLSKKIMLPDRFRDLLRQPCFSFLKLRDLLRLFLQSFQAKPDILLFLLKLLQTCLLLFQLSFQSLRVRQGFP